MATAIRRISNLVKKVMDKDLEMEYEHACLLDEFRQYVASVKKEHRKVRVITLFTEDTESIRSKIKIENSILGHGIEIKSCTLNGKPLDVDYLYRLKKPRQRTIFVLAKSKANSNTYNAEAIAAIKNSTGLDIIQVTI